MDTGFLDSPMNLEIEVGEALREAFRAALVLTCSIESAEFVVTNALQMLGSDFSRKMLLVATARAAFQQSILPGESSSILPAELKALALLPTTCRYCFVLRVLIGFDPGICSEILTMSRHDIQEALCQSLLALPGAVESIRPVAS